MPLSRRRRDRQSPPPEETAEPGETAEYAAEDPEEPGDGWESGPWDAADDVPDVPRLDFGSLLVPASEEFEVRIGMADTLVAWITVVTGGSELQLQAFAAPRDSGLWEDVRDEIAAEIERTGGTCEPAEGPFGAELRARVRPAPEDETATGLQPARFLGVDGPRWFLRGVISGPAAERAEDAVALEAVFGGIVVVRGEHPAPPRDPLEIRLPPDLRRALADELGQPQETEAEDDEGEDGEPDQPSGRWAGIRPPERGPEITEIR